MHFYHPIQQSAPHIYHSALPLSPRSSSLRPIIPHEKTLISDFHGCPDSWGAVIRTIKPIHESFTYVTTFGHWIAAISQCRTVAIYDSITGALRLHLSPGGLVYTISGFPDGSTLFCAHHESSITGWDIQTGGIIHTFIAEDPVRTIAICSNGYYLASGSFDGSVKIWEIANKSEVATFGRGERVVTHICWLEPGKQLVVARPGSAEVWDVVARRVLRSFTTNDEICGLAYAQRLDRFAIATTSETKGTKKTQTQSTITVVDPHTGTSFIHRTSHQISCLAFSPITNEFVCSMGSHGVGLFSVPARSWRRFDHKPSITSISTLLDGTLVAEVEEMTLTHRSFRKSSSLQLLSLDEGCPPPQPPIALEGLVYTLDEGNIIVLHPKNLALGSIVLLETATMSKIAPNLVSKIHPFSTFFCASLKHRIVAYYSNDAMNSPYLKLWRFGDETPSQIARESTRPLAGWISPSGSRLVAIACSRTTSLIRVWDIENGTRVAGITVEEPELWPTSLRFESEDKFYLHQNTFRIPFTISGSSIIRHEQLPPAEQPLRHYDVDDSREWIIGSSKRVCWIPPEYIRRHEVEKSYCWVGNTFITAGQDGVVRKLTFRESS